MKILYGIVGEFHEYLTEDNVKGFLSKTEEYTNNLKSYKQDGNEKILTALDNLLNKIENKS